MSLRFLPCLVLTACLLAMPAYGMGGTQKLLGTFGKWRAYTFEENGQPVCYMGLSATLPASKKLKRGTARLTITHRPSEGSKDVVSYTPGYSFKPESVVKLTAGKSSYELFTTRDSAWARDPASDRAVSAAIRHNAMLMAVGFPAQKSAPSVIDRITLDGAAKAYAAIGKACGVDTDELKPAPKAKKSAAPAHTKSNVKTKAKSQ